MTDTNNSDLVAAPVVQTTLGRVRGQLLHGIYEDAYYSFEGVPYAAPPLGALRFKAPQAAQPWQDIRDCTEPAPKCLQLPPTPRVVQGSEDCLYLNIYVKRLRSLSPLPVMVYVHGGGYRTGDPTRRAWAPDYFMQRDVILITIGYRLGVFGFLSFADPSLEVPGNAGLKDIVQALKWIRNNCANFNGDAANITLFGNSSGAMAVHLLLLSPQAEHLVHKAILMGGYSPSLNRLPNLELRLAQHLGYTGDACDEQAIFHCIKSAAPARLADYDFLTPVERKRWLVLTFRPCVEPYVTPTAVLLEEPLQLQRKAWSNCIPIMMGNTAIEALPFLPFFLRQQYYIDCKQSPEILLPTDMLLCTTREVQRQVAKQLMQLHYEGRALCMANYKQALEHASYQFTYHAQHRLLLARLKYASNFPTYVFRFDFDSPDFNFSRIRYLGAEKRGAGHVDDLGYIFVMPETFKLDATRAEYRNIQRMIGMWVEFAQRSDPNAEIIAPVVWQPVQPSGPRMCLNISTELSFVPIPETAKCYQIDQLYELAKMDLY